MNKDHDSNNPEYLVRPRINALLTSAVKKPLTIVCAGAGSGKTLAVSDFTRSCGIRTVWLQLTGQDNVASRFWEHYITNAARSIDYTFAEIKELGLPDTEEKFNQFIAVRDRHLPNCRYISVIDDINIIDNCDVIHFLERLSANIPKYFSLIFICREFPKINITGMETRNLIANVNNGDLNFTENELSQLLLLQGLRVEPQILRQIFQDTNGWAFSVNLIARSLKRSPGYMGYVRNAVKQNIFKLMETEAWVEVSEQLRRFMTRISLIDHLSADLVCLLAAGNESLLAELGRQNAYIRYDIYINAYLIHNLFLDFLRTKQGILTDSERFETYNLAANWCRKNGFIVDALGYYEKIGDYESIVSVFIESLVYMPSDLAQRALGIFERAPADTFDRVKFFAVMHIFTVISAGRWQEFFKLAEYYEQKFLKSPENNDFRNHTLGGLYLYWGYIRLLMCTIDDNYNFDVYYAKMADCFTKVPSEFVKRIPRLMGPWICMAGSARKGAPIEYIEALTRTVKHVSRCSDNTMGYADLTLGELLFYQDNIQAAEPLFNKVLGHARENRQFEAVHIALFYTARIAVLQGNFKKFGQAVKDMETQLYEKEYYLGLFNYDIAIGWYHYILRQPEMLPGWLKEKFAPYSHAYFVANFGNHMKARYHYLTKNYPPLLAYIDEMKRRESILYGRVELLAMEACVYYQMKDKTAAFAALREAYDAAIPNNILMPFIELGKDMRSLASAALRDAINIPSAWLETVRRRSATYAKNHSLLLYDYKKAGSRGGSIVLSARESEILLKLYHGLSRSEIADKTKLSVNTVNSAVSNIFNKLGAHSIVDVIRIAKERRLV